MQTPPILRKRDAIRERYTSVTGEGPFNVWLKSGGITFCVTPITAFEDRETAEMHRQLLAACLLQIVREQEKEP